MARINSGLPSNLYSGGAVVLNSDPYANYYLQTQQRKQAQDDALFKYFGDLGKNITPKGMHSNDIPELVNQKNAWQQYAVQHKKEIARPSLDGGKAYQQAMGMYNNMMAHAETSREKVKLLGGIASIYKDPNKRGLLTEKTLEDIKQGELPVTDPNYKPIDPTALNYNPRPFGIQEQSQLTTLLNKFRPTESVDGTPESIPGTNQEKVKYKSTFNQDQLKGMYNIGSSLYHNNPSFKNMVDEEADPLSNNYQPMNEIYKQYFGKDIASPEDMAVAHVLSLHPNRQGREQIRNKSVSPFDLIAARNKSAKDLIDYRQTKKDGSSQDQADAVNSYWNGQIENAKKNPIKFYPKEGGEVIQYQIPATTETKKLFTYKNDKGHNISADDIRLSADGKDIMFYFYKRDEDGNILNTANGKKSIDEEHSGRATMDEVKLRLGKQMFGTKANVKAMSGGGNNAPKPKSDPLKLF